MPSWKGLESIGHGVGVELIAYARGGDGRICDTHDDESSRLPGEHRWHVLCLGSDWERAADCQVDRAVANFRNCRS